MIKEQLIVSCEEEQIHLCGKIQNFGYLVIFNLSGECISLSENCLEWIPLEVPEILNQKTDYFLQLINADIGLTFDAETLHALQEIPASFKTFINESCYQLTIYVNNEQLFFEFEKNESLLIELNKLNEFQLNFEKSNDVWSTLCENIYKITDFDRVLIYQFLEDNSGIVVAEKNRITESFVGYRYPEFDIPIQARKLYLKNHSRQTPDIKAQTFNILGLSAQDIDLSKSQIRALSPIHLKYLENTGVQASASFSIVIDNKLWGIVACQNIKPKYIPYDKRNLCIFISQYAAIKYLVKKQRTALKQNNIISEIELQLKEKLFYSKAYEKTLSEFAEQFTRTLSADGMIIHAQDNLIKFGSTPSDYLFEMIHYNIQQSANHQNIFTSHNFTLAQHPEKLEHVGIARLSFDLNDEFTIYWFRREILIEEKWAGKPEKLTDYSQERNAYVYSPRTSFQLWKKNVEGESEKWSKFDLEFLKRIHKLIQDSLYKKMNEIKALNQKLIETNNTLETYTHELAHDLKNPLSTIKTCAQFLHTKPNLTTDIIQKFSNNIYQAANLTHDIIEKTLESARSSSNIFNFEFIQTKSFIHQIINQAKIAYKVDQIDLHLGDLHPVLGEKTLLYQLFMNIINNAIKFSSKNETITLEIRSEQTKKHTTYYIKDNGIGISQAEKEHVFSIFKRLSNAEEFEGTGVGMSIVKRIVERLHAEISFTSEVKVGTTFKIKFQNEQ